MPTKLSVNRTQWAVGNGFFHTGRVSTTASSLDYVYDCGALGSNAAALVREIDEYASRTASVDVMFISHFDFDHVSGIPLLAHHMPVGRFIIPLIPEPERLFILAGNLSDPSIIDGSDDAAFYQDFMIDPEATLRGLRTNQIAPAAVETIAPSSAPAVSIETEVPEFLSRSEVRDAKKDADLTLEFGPRRVKARSQRIVWEWKFFVASQARSATKQFVDALISSKLISRRGELRDHQVLSDLVMNHGRELVLAYDAATKAAGSSFTRNLTSLMMYSGPPVGTRYRAYRTRSHNVERAEIGAWNPKPAWLGFGDADLRSKKRVDEVNAAFHRHKPYVGTFAPSHHGARPDWHKDFLSGYDPDNKYPPTYVFGTSGHYRSRADKAILHPNGDVVLAINESGGTAVLVGQEESSRWTESLTVFVSR